MATLGVDNLASLPELDENVLLQELKGRYQQNIFYTYIGDILLAVNPYKNLSLYDTETMHRYSNMISRSALPPHIFAVSDAAFSSLCSDNCSQCCIVSGESGAGKTESTKLLVQHVVHLCSQQSNNLHQRIIEVNPLLEAFGNAQTVMNNNSSRFGKFIELQLNHNRHLYGAAITEYLLEKSRVVQQSAGERNFHIFYYLFAGLEPSTCEINLLKDPALHRIMKPVDGTNVYQDTEAREQCKQSWQHILKIMHTIGFNADQREAIIAMLTAVIHIADINLIHDADTDGVYIDNEEVLEIVCLLLGLKAEDLAGALIANVTKLRGEEIVSLKNVYQASDGRDALAKALYGRMFGWIVRQTNTLLSPADRNQREMFSIGILDIYGFENFRHNSFEQLCINTANEQLQMFFNRHVFRSELEAYAVEGIKATAFQFTDNEPLVKLLLDSLGVYAIIDEESKFPKATDLTLIEKMTKTFMKQSSFQRVKNQNLHFIIRHFAGPVTYNVYGFLEKNRDTLSQNLFDVMKQSESAFVSDLFSAVLRDTGSFTSSSVGVRRPRGAGRKSVILNKPLELKRTESTTKKLQAQLHEKKTTKQKPEEAAPPSKTLAGYFRNSLKELIGKMSSANPHFIRCIKPNTMKSSDSFDDELVAKQLKYTGVIETVNIRRQGFALRLPFETFIHRYKFIAFPLLSKVEDGPNNCQRIISSAGITGCEIGKTKVFLRYYHADELNSSLQRSVKLIVTCQAYVRGLVIRHRYQNWVQQQRDATQRMCEALQQLVIGVSSQHADIQRRLCQEDIKAKEQAEQIERQQQTSAAAVLVRKQSTRSAHSTSSSVHDDASLEALLADTVRRMPALGSDIWCKLHYLEKGHVTAKFYISEWKLVVNSSPTKYNGQVIGLSNADIAHCDSTEIMDILDRIGKGVKIDRDSHGNIYLTKLSDCEVIVKGFQHPESHCIANAVVETSGRVGSKKTKIYDIMKFMSLVADQFRRMPVNIERIQNNLMDIQKLSMIEFSFIKDTELECDTPCWISIINLCALDVLSNKRALTDVITMAGVQLSEQEIERILNMWRSIHKRRSVVPNCASLPTST